MYYLCRDNRQKYKNQYALKNINLDIKDDDFVMIFPARLDKNKNQGFLIKVMAELVSEHPEMQLLLPGKDELNGKYQLLTKKSNFTYKK